MTTARESKPTANHVGVFRCPRGVQTVDTSLLASIGVQIVCEYLFSGKCGAATANEVPRGLPHGEEASAFLPRGTLEAGVAVC